MNPVLLASFAKYIEEQLGIIYAEHNYFQLQSRLEELVKSEKMESVEALYKSIRERSRSELNATLLDLATNNETSFFRDPKVFKELERVVLPECATKVPPYSKLRIWSAASSFGQEPFSLSILMHELAAKTKMPPHEILATDVSDRALARAKEGRYTTHEIGRGLSEEMKSRYFEAQDKDQHAVRSNIKAPVQFRRLNLKEPLPEIGQFQLILCRNVLLYQRVESKAEIVAKLAHRLMPGGYLVLGAGESMLGVSDAFDQLNSEGTVFYRLKQAA